MRRSEKYRNIQKLLTKENNFGKREGTSEIISPETGTKIFTI